MPPAELYPPALAITSCFCPLSDSANNAEQKTSMYLFIQGCFYSVNRILPVKIYLFFTKSNIILFIFVSDRKKWMNCRFKVVNIPKSQKDYEINRSSHIFCYFFAFILYV